MSSSPEDPKASDDAGEMEKEKEADARKRKPTGEPCPDCSDEGEEGGDVAKEPELPPLSVAPSSWPAGASRSRSSRLPPSPLSSPPSSYPVAAEAAAKLLRLYDSDTASIPSSADPYIPEILPDIPEAAELGFVVDEEDEIPYIGDVEPLSSLADEYQSSTSIFQKKIQLLRAKYSGIRRVKRDGNCFYRCFMFAYLEYLLVSQNDAEMGRVLASVERLRQRLFELGKPPVIVSNYCDVFIDMVKRIRKGKMNCTDLLQSCREEDTSDDLVKFHRMVAACEMRRREDHYAPFVAGISNTTVEEYCRRSVEPLREETEIMEIRALSDALGVSLRLENLDQSLTNGVPELIGFDIQPDNDTTDDDAQQPPLITLLYRPGHYDILYPIADPHMEI